MKKLPLFISFLVISTSVFSQPWLWGIKGAGLGTAYGSVESNSVTIDAKGNAYLAADFVDSVMFGSYKIKSKIMSLPNKYEGDIFLIKVDSIGNILWSAQSNRSSNNSSIGIDNGFPGTSLITTDKKGNSYLTGFFSDSVYFGSYLLTGLYVEAFLVKYDVNGNVSWAVQSAIASHSFSYVHGNSIITDEIGNVYLAGEFQDTIAFGTSKLYSKQPSFFLTKYDSSGKVIWAKQTKESNYYRLSTNILPSIAIDKMNNIYMTGYFDDTINFGSSTLVSPNPAYNFAAFLTKYDSSGNVIWAKQSGTIADSSRAESFSVITDNADNIYITGFFNDTVTFGADTLKRSAISPRRVSYGSIFLVKYDPDGNIIWAKQSRGDTAEYGWSGWSLKADSLNYIYLACGSYKYWLRTDSLIFLNDTFPYTASYSEPSFVAKLDTGANVLCSSLIVAGGDDQNAIAVSPSGKYVYLGGDIHTTVVLGNDTLHECPACENSFIARWEPCYKGLITEVSETKPDLNIINVYPNPFSVSTNVVFNNNGKHYLELNDMTGRRLKSIICEGSQYALHLNDIATGIYFIYSHDSENSPVSVKKIIIE